MNAKISVISVILKPFIPHDISLIISITCSHSSILSLLKTYIFSDFYLLHNCNSDTPQFLQTHLILDFWIKSFFYLVAHFYEHG